MSTDQEITEKFWKSLKSDRTFMLGLDGLEQHHAQPMTAMFDKGREEGPIYIFTSRDTDLARQMGHSHAASAHYESKGHDIFACLQGTLSVEENRGLIDRLWNPFVAAWFEGGQTDPKLLLLRFDPNHATIWENESTFTAGLKLLLKRDPKKDYQDKIAEVRM